MITYYDNHRTYDVLRLHPYAPGDLRQNGFVDFKKYPEKISTVLEDFVPHSEHAAIQTFYKLLEYINGEGSFIETCDCALRSPGLHSDSNSDMPIAVHGRLFLMYRDQTLNCSKKHAEWLCGKLMSLLNQNEPDLTEREAVIGFTLNPVLHTEISNGIWMPDGQFECDEDDPGNGVHTMLSFWSYGNDDNHAFENLDRVFKNLKVACVELNSEIKKGLESSRHETQGAASDGANA